jgi:molybdenum cofactor cytidylyltransferase
VDNPDWAGGLSTSIHAAVRRASDCDLLALMLGDQPYVPSAHVAALIGLLKSGGRVAASRYPDGRLGVPAAFSRDLFPALLTLQGDSGAKGVIEQATDVAWADLAEWRDIDREEDVDQLNAETGSTMNIPGHTERGTS